MDAIIVILCSIILTLILICIFYFLGKKIIKKISFFRYKKTVSEKERETFIGNLTSTLTRLSASKVGALIVIKNKENLAKYIEVGNKIDAAFFPEFIYTIFDNHNSPLHDGAIVVDNLRIASISSYLPVSKRVIGVNYGSRHRAALGITELSDAVAFVVSETTGNITFVHRDSMTSLSINPPKLYKQIKDKFDYIGIGIDSNINVKLNKSKASVDSSSK